MSTDTIYFKAHCDWTIWGEMNMTTAEWVNELLKIWQGEDGTDGRENFFLQDFQVTETSDNGAWGLRYARFWVITRVFVGELTDVEDIIKNRLDQMVGDTDVSVRFTERLLERPTPLKL